MPLRLKSSRIRAHILAAYLLIPCAVFLMAFIPVPVGDKTPVHTTPYVFNMPDKLFPVMNPTDNRPTEEGVVLGRRLFYDPILSGNQKQACAGCHKQELAFTDGLPLSVGTNGHNARRNSMALINLGWQDNYFWDRRASALEELIHFPVTDSLEMNADISVIEKRLSLDKNYKLLFHNAFGKDTITMKLAAMAISQFLRTIVSYNAPFDRIFRDYVYNGGAIESKTEKITDNDLLTSGLIPANADKYNHDSALVYQIKDIAASPKVLSVFSVCLTCHYNSFQIFCINCNGDLPANAVVQYKNNGLDSFGTDIGLYQTTKNTEDKYRFKVPTLRNIAYTAPYMHDGRFKTLEEVVDHYNEGILPNPNLDTLLQDGNGHPRKFGMNESEKKQLVKLIKLFSDPAVTTDPRFASPFLAK